MMSKKELIEKEHLDKIHCLMQDGMYKEAENLIKQTLKHVKGPKTKAELIVNQGVCRFCLGKIEESLKLYHKAVMLNPELEKDPNFHLDSGYAYYEKSALSMKDIKLDKPVGDDYLRKAKSHLEKVIELNRSHPRLDEIYLKLAYINFFKGRRKNGKEFFLKVAQISKTKEMIGEAYFMIGVILEDEELCSNSNEAFTKALKYLKDFDLIASSHFHIGVNYYFLKKYNIANEMLNEVLKLSKEIKDLEYRRDTERDTHFYLGNSYLELKNYDKARHHLNLALKLAKKNERKNVKVSLKYLDAKEKGLIKEE